MTRRRKSAGQVSRATQTSPLLGEFGFFWRVGRTFELEPVPVRVGDRSDPHSVADKGTLGDYPSRPEFVVERHRVLADEADGNPDPEFIRGNVVMFSGPPELLEHQGGTAQFEPAPAQLAVVHPLDGLRKPEAVGVEAK